MLPEFRLHGSPLAHSLILIHWKLLTIVWNSSYPSRQAQVNPPSSLVQEAWFRDRIFENLSKSEQIGRFFWNFPGRVVRREVIFSVIFFPGQNVLISKIMTSNGQLLFSHFALYRHLGNLSIIIYFLKSFKLLKYFKKF